MTPAQLMERAMKDSGTKVRITRPGQGEPVLDNTSGALTHPPPTTVYEGPALLNVQNRAERTAIRGGEQETMTDWQLSVPISAGPVKIGDQVEVTANRSDPQMVGLKMWAARLPSGSHVARRRVICSSTQVGPRT